MVFPSRYSVKPKLIKLLEEKKQVEVTLKEGKLMFGDVEVKVTTLEETCRPTIQKSSKENVQKLADKIDVQLQQQDQFELREMRRIIKEERGI